MSGALISSAMNGIVVPRLAELAEAHAIGVGRGQLHVVDNLVPSRQLVVGADLEAEELLGRLQRPGRGGHAVDRRRRERQQIGAGVSMRHGQKTPNDDH